MIKSVVTLKRVAVHPLTGALFDNCDALEEDGNSALDSLAAHVPLRTFQQMGEPAEITVTIEPGDTLNNHPKGSL